jgi:hypothetical protein
VAARRRDHRHLPDVIYATSFADTRVLSPNLDVPLRGTIVVDGRTLVLEGDPGGQTHVWGRKHADSWAWATATPSRGTAAPVLESFTARLKRRGVVLPPLTLVSLYLDGEAHRLTGLPPHPEQPGRYGTARYQFLGVGPMSASRRIRLPPRGHGAHRIRRSRRGPGFCANTEVADLRVTVSRRSRLWKRCRSRPA